MFDDENDGVNEDNISDVDFEEFDDEDEFDYDIDVECCVCLVCS